MRKLALAAVSAAGLGTVGIMAPAHAMPLSAPGAVQAAATEVALTRDVQVFVWEHRRYCWYPDGWHGPGFYWCGYAWREGLGWGGPLGWHGWYVGHRGFAHRGEHGTYTEGVGGVRTYGGHGAHAAYVGRTHAGHMTGHPGGATHMGHAQATPGGMGHGTSHMGGPGGMAHGTSHMGGPGGGHAAGGHGAGGHGGPNQH